MSYGTYNSFSEFEAEVSEYNKQFKAIIARERNSLPTKIFLKTATSDIKAVKNAMKKRRPPPPHQQIFRLLSGLSGEPSLSPEALRFSPAAGVEGGAESSSESKIIS